MCQEDVVEDEKHFLTACPAMVEVRTRFQDEITERLSEVRCSVSSKERVHHVIAQGGTPMQILALGGLEALIKYLNSSLPEDCQLDVDREYPTAAIRAVWRTSLNFVASLWKQRCRTLGGVFRVVDNAITLVPVDKSFLPL